MPLFFLSQYERRPAALLCSMLSDPIPSVAPHVGTRLCREVLTSAHLGRDVELSILLPPGAVGAALLPVLYLNDGQDLERLHLQSTLDALYASGALRPFVLVAPHANEQRVQEYGHPPRFQRPRQSGGGLHQFYNQRVTAICAS